MKWMDMIPTSTGRRGMGLLLNRQCSWEAVRSYNKANNGPIFKYYFKKGFLKIHVIFSGGSSMHSWSVPENLLPER